MCDTNEEVLEHLRGLTREQPHELYNKGLYETKVVIVIAGQCISLDFDCRILQDIINVVEDNL